MTSFLQALNRRHVPWRWHGSKPGNIWICCVYCDDRRFRLGLDLRYNQGHCFNCDWAQKRGALRLVANALNVGEGLDLSGTVDLATAPPVIAEKAEPLPKDFDFADRDEEAMTYLLRRGMTPEQVNLWSVGCSRSGRARYRVIFPKWEGTTVKFWAARDWTGKQEPPWLMSTGAKGLYGTVAPTVVLVEGVFDMMALERAGADAVALLGTSLSDSVNAELANTDKIILWLDPDKAGRKGIKELAREWMASKELHLVTAPIEPGDVNDGNAVAGFLRNAIPLTRESLWRWRLKGAA